VTQAGGSNYTLSPDIKKLQTAARDLVQKVILPLEADLDYDAIEMAPDDHKRVVELVKEAGLWNMGVPEEYGGSGLGAFARAVIYEELVQHRAGLYRTFYDTLGHGAYGGLYAYGTPYHKETYLLPTLRGERQGGMAVTEPSGGSDPARAIKSFAVRDGDDWILNGSKMFGIGAQADYTIIFARTDPNSRRGMTAFILDKGMPGFVATPWPVQRSTYPAMGMFDNVRVPGKNVLGEVDNAWKMMAYEGLAKNRVGYSVSNLGISVAAHRTAVEDCKSRETFGAPLSTRQAVQWMLVDSEIEIKSNRWICWESAWQVDADEDFRFAASLAKVHSAEVLQRVLDRSMVIMGARALSKETSFDRWYREARIRRIGEGPSEVQRIVVSRDLLSVGSGVNPPTESVQ